MENREGPNGRRGGGCHGEAARGGGRGGRRGGKHNYEQGRGPGRAAAGDPQGRPRNGEEGWGGGRGRHNGDESPRLGVTAARETAMKAGAVAEGRITAAKAPALGSQLARETARKQMPAAVEALEATPSKQDSALEARAISPCSKRRAASGMVPQGMMQAFPSRMESGRRPTAGGKSGRTARKEMPALE
ncbi:hypothetical protein PVAP13_7NG005479 [Panicum virgatum]|uniref:Uncharacterized protein n=1 Tax=Panicum virgatum TaxID=38727 RepID=A0A8T0PRM8_PANVG|nr:hypothetical protein PVAP13_7NG005479 [Panicum virgatum]